MRSQLIFEAHGRIANRYRLCHAVAKVTRCLHGFSANTQDAISDALLRVAHVPCLVDDTPETPPGAVVSKRPVYAGDADLGLWYGASVATPALSSVASVTGD